MARRRRRPRLRGRRVEGKALSPVLVIRGEGGADIADGYHRVSLVYRIDPYAVVPLKLA